VSEAELIEVFLNYVALLDSQLLGYISVLSGFIVVSYFAASKLTTLLAGIVVTLYSFTCGLFLTRIVFLRRDFVELHMFMVEQRSANVIDIPWFGTNPPWASEMLNYLMIGVTVGGYLGSVLFFFIQRGRACREA
jgi:hypothetical protein